MSSGRLPDAVNTCQFCGFGVIAPQSVLLWLRARRHGQLGTRGGGVCIWTRVFHRVGNKQMWYACSGKFSSSQAVTGFSKEIRRVKAENIGAKLERTRVCRCLVFDSGRLRTFMRQSHSADWLFVLRQRDSCCRVIVPLSAVCYRILVVCVSPGDLSGDAPKILRSGTRTVCRVRDECSLRNFCMCFSWDLSGDAPKILRSGTRTVCRVRDEFSLWIFCRCFSWGSFRRRAQDP